MEDLRVKVLTDGEVASQGVGIVSAVKVNNEGNYDIFIDGDFTEDEIVWVLSNLAEQLAFLVAQKRLEVVTQ